MPLIIPASFAEALAACPQWLVCGLEREGLRVDQNGLLATSPHPREFGAKLTHPKITTDFGESQLELITNPHPTTAGALAELGQLHAWVWRKLDAELLWPYSMPCGLPEQDQDIAIADYGKSNAASLKHIYRLGLAYRYGRAMQTVSGVHLNLSLTDQLFTRLASSEGEANTQGWRNHRYFALMRNYRRHCYLVNYLLGASPVIDASLARLSRTIRLRDFAPVGPPLAQQPDVQPLVGVGATTLRQSDIGYVAPQQRGMSLCFNQLDNYIRGVNERIATPHPPFAAITNQHGQFKQLGNGLLQIENEFYTPIRPKRPTRKGQRPLLALAESGIEYLELRNLDINPFAPCGIDQTALDFMALLFLWCAALPSPEFSQGDCNRIESNELISATRGRVADIRIALPDGEAPLSEATAKALDALEVFAAQLAAIGQHQYAEALASVRADGPLSQLVEDACARNNYRRFCLEQARVHRASLPQPSDELHQELTEQTQHSWKDLAEIEAAYAANPLPFGAYFADYMQGNF